MCWMAIIASQSPDNWEPNILKHTSLKFKTRVSLTPDIQPDDLTIKAEYAAFLTHTHLDELRPGCDLSMSIPGKYRLLQEQIEEHRHFMGINQQREISL